MPNEILLAQAETATTESVTPIVEQSPTAAQLIKTGQFEELLDQFLTGSIDFLGKVLIALLIFYLGRWIIKQIDKVFKRMLNRKVDDIALRSFLMNILNIALFATLIILIINIVGSKTVSLVALIGSIGLALGLAVKDNLANFAGGVMLLFNKPFRGGDYIEAQSVAGTVQSVGILYTTLTTFDNKTVHIPNGPLSTGNIINYSTQATRRVDLTVNVDYGSDVELVKRLLLDIAENHPQVLRDPEPSARMVKMNDSSIDFTLKVWAKGSDFWPVTFDLNEQAYDALVAHGLNIPFPQMTVHMAKD
ncbi:MAG: mechanosensitive ion channel domain-containing protein [Proteiniphilum sp.]|jgi:small conductance mechanosensitive channel|nr:mechanosensitive ion channel [Proteiniphilum sp.]MDD3331585.1 mechanosensitive ion channel [Proteiniphilum sp.]MDD3978982.1 mechanosensitive ion channel [Proteiniphilum sp.]MDD5345546.1 mechanosensitive ion channel [Proteiniphilum sp.]MDY0183705.1 mechanosensitive ion channel [Proteiniphilum sp.]